MKLLLDANISPETVIFLRSFGYNVESLIELGLGDLNDMKVAEMAQRKKRTLITFDLDFGEMYYFASHKKFNVIVLRLYDQRVESVNSILEQFFQKYRKNFGLKQKRLAIITEDNVRISE